MHPGFYPEDISQRILFDATAEILVTAAAHGTFNLHRIVRHDMKPFNQAAYFAPGNHKASVRRVGRHKSPRIVNASAVTPKRSRMRSALPTAALSEGISGSMVSSNLGKSTVA